MDEIAEALKTQREALGLRHQDIFERTRINPEFLEALEAGQFNVLPEAYVRLFLKTYARELGLDADALVARYEAQYAPAKPEAPPPPPTRSQAPIAVIAIAVAILFIAIIFALRFTMSETGDVAAPLDSTVAPIRQTPFAMPPQKNALPRAQDTGAPAPPGASADAPEETSTAPTPPAATSAQPEAVAPADSASAAPTTDTAPAPPDAPAQNAPLFQPQIDAPAAESPLEAPPTDTVAQAATPSEIAAPTLQEADAAPPSTTEPEPPAPGVYDLPVPARISADQPMVLSGIVRQTTRLRVSADGRSIFSGELRVGSRPRWQARDSFRVHMDRADAIDLALQGQTLSPPQSANHSIRLLVTRTQIRVEEIPPSNAQTGADR